MIVIRDDEAQSLLLLVLFLFDNFRLLLAVLHKVQRSFAI